MENQREARTDPERKRPASEDKDLRTSDEPGDDHPKLFRRKRRGRIRTIDETEEAPEPRRRRFVGTAEDQEEGRRPRTAARTIGSHETGSKGRIEKP